MINQLHIKYDLDTNPRVRFYTLKMAMFCTQIQSFLKPFEAVAGDLVQTTDLVIE